MVEKSMKLYTIYQSMELKNKGTCIECGHYFYECAYQDICPECEKRENDQHQQDEDIEPFPEPWVM